jgi:hypothetical protein
VSRHRGRTAFVLGCCAAALLSLPRLAQGQGAQQPAATPAPAERPVEDPGAQIDEILAGEEAVLAGGTYSYDPGNRRDPFKSLLIGQNRQATRGPMPEGIAGLLIDEIDLTGIFRTSRGFVAQVVAANRNKSFLLREGDQLYDGDVVSVTQNEVVFKQIVNDPTVIKPFREVVKKLSP